MVFLRAIRVLKLRQNHKTKMCLGGGHQVTSIGHNSCYQVITMVKVGLI